MSGVMDGRRCKRDKHGWRIPAEGTKAREIYDLARTGLSSPDIAARVGRSSVYVGVVICKCREGTAEPCLSARERSHRGR